MLGAADGRQIVPVPGQTRPQKVRGERGKYGQGSARPRGQAPAVGAHEPSTTGGRVGHSDQEGELMRTGGNTPARRSCMIIT